MPLPPADRCLKLTSLPASGHRPHQTQLRACSMRQRLFSRRFLSNQGRRYFRHVPNSSNDSKLSTAICFFTLGFSSLLAAPSLLILGQPLETVSKEKFRKTALHPRPLAKQELPASAFHGESQAEFTVLLGGRSLIMPILQVRN